MTSLQKQLVTVPGVSRVLDGGRSADGQAEQLLVLADQQQRQPERRRNLIDGCARRSRRRACPPG